MKGIAEIPTHDYPRALPYSPPREQNSPSWRYWPHVVILLVLIAVAEFWLLGVRGNQSQAALPDDRNSEATKPESERPIAKDKYDAAGPNRLLLETLGAWSATHVYQNYLNIGMLADAVAHHAYGEDDAYAILATTTGFLQMMERQMDNIARVMDSEDQQSLDKIRRLNRLLQKQADALVLSWETGDQKMEDDYLRVRTESWDGIQEIMGIE